MEFHTVLDISSIIWNKVDYNTNTNEYYQLRNAILVLLEKLEREKPKILLRDELLVEMTNGFPFYKLPEEFYAFGHSVYSFLSNIGSELITYSDSTIANIISIPNQIKNHYNDNTKDEANYLISKIHSDDESESVYFTFKHLWNGNDKLKTSVGTDSIEYETIISDRGTELDDFFAKIKPVFEHHSKHDQTEHNTKEKWKESDDKTGFISRLSCYNGNDKIEPQRLLDIRYPNKIGNCYYSYDITNEVYVTFRFTESNIYHAYDEYNIEKIPEKVRQHFNKWKYKWH